MIIGAHEEFIGIKPQSVISTENFVYFKNDEFILFPEAYIPSIIAFEINAQAP